MSKFAWLVIAGALAITCLILLIRNPALDKTQWLGIILALLIGTLAVFSVDTASPLTINGGDYGHL